MLFYTATSRVLPRHYAARMFALSFSAVHIPLVTFILVEAIRGQWSWPLFTALLVATVVGSVVAIAGLAGMLRPVEIATEAMRALRDGKPVGRIPAGAPDLAGELLETVAHAVRTTSARIDALEELAETDMLTGLLNRRGFFSEMERMGYPGGAVALFDANGFKAINDQHGHAEGDRVLRGMADRLVRHLSTTATLVRWGGDEFLAFVPDETCAAIQGKLDRIARSLRTQPISSAKAPVSFSIGCEDVAGGEPLALEAAIAAADTSMYREKRERVLPTS